MKYYDVYVQGQKYKTIVTEGGYNFNEVVNGVHQDVADGKLVVKESTNLQIQVKPVE